MINLIEKFEQHEEAIAKYIDSCVDKYSISECFSILADRITTLGNSNDLKPSALKFNRWISQVVFPIVKERALLRRAITAANYRSSDIFLLDPNGDTPAENAAEASTVLNLNMKNTKFKMRTLKPGINTASKFGTSVFYTYWKVHNAPELQTIYNEQTGRYDRVEKVDRKRNAFNCEIPLLDYFQNPDVPEPDESDYQGHHRTYHVSELIPLLEDQSYIRVNLRKVLDDIKDKKSTISKRPERCRSRGKGYVDAVMFEGHVAIDGNEDCYKKYRAIKIGKEIIRFSVDDYDRNMGSYSVSNFDKRQEYWWGNPDSEYVVSHENFLNTFLSMSADNALSSMMQYIFFQKGTIDGRDVANARSNSNFIPVDVEDLRLNQLVAPFQPGALNLGPANFITQTVNDSVQKMSTKVDLSRKSEAGGVQNNSTATAANIIAGQADVLENDILENYDFGVTECGNKNLILLQQFLPENFYVRPRPQEQARLMDKFAMMGDFAVTIHSTAMKNKQNELLRLQNLATWLMNVLMNPQMQQSGMNVLPLVRDVLQKAEVPSINDIIPESNMAAAAPGYVPSAQPASTGPDILSQLQAQQ